MSKQGKFKKQSAMTGATAPQTTGMMLQTYFTSLLSLVVCVAMFFGTSYAWFTSEVTNEGNEIYIGVLDVGLFKVEGENKLDLAGTETKLFDKNIRWEPGYTSLETIQVVNEGDLAFDYVLSFTDGKFVDAKGETVALAADALPLGDVAKHFDVWVYDHSEENGTPNPQKYSDIQAANSGWQHAGSLAELLAGKSVLGGGMGAVTSDVKATDTYTIALHMDEEATTELTGKRISLSVKLVAYQKGAEKDSFGNGNYDNMLSVASDVTTLNKALNDKVSQVLLASSMEIQNTADRVTLNGGVLDGNGNTITYKGGRISDSSVGVVTTSGGTINNLKIDGGEDGRALYVTKLESNLMVSNCTFSGAYSFNLNSSVSAKDYTIDFKDTTFNDWTSYADVAKMVNFTGCTFNGVLKPYGDTTLSKCKFTVDDSGKTSIDVSKLTTGSEIVLEKCTFGDITIESATVTKSGEEGITSNNTMLSVSDGMLVVNKGTG